MPGQRGVVAADHRRHTGWLLMHHVGAAGQVDRGADEGLIERDERVTEPGYARFVAERLAQRLAEGDARILHRVVRVDLDVAFGPDRQPEAAVLAELGEHVVEERDAGLDIDGGGAVEVELDKQLRLLGLAGHAPDPGHSPSTFVSAALNAAVSCGVPTVTRSQPSGPVLRIS